MVEVNDGPEEGKRGQVIDRHWQENTVTVEGVQVEIKREMNTESSNLFNPDFTSKEVPSPIHFSKVSLIDPSLDVRTEAEWRKKDGRMARVSLSSGTGSCARTQLSHTPQLP